MGSRGWSRLGEVRHPTSRLAGDRTGLSTVRRFTGADRGPQQDEIMGAFRVPEQRH